MSSSEVPSFLPSFPLPFDHLLPLALLIIGAAIVGELLFRAFKIPKITGYAIVGLIGSIIGWSLPSGDFAHEVRPLIDIALALSLFELGARVDLQWISANQRLLWLSLFESLLTFIAVTGAMILLGFGVPGAISIGVVSIATSPAITMRVIGELKSRGQLTERILLLAALNCVYAVIAAKLILGYLYGEYQGAWLQGIAHGMYLVCGSLIVSFLLAKLVAFFGRKSDWRDENSFLLLIGLLLATIAITHMFKLSVLITPLVAGMLLRRQSQRLLLWAPSFGSAGSVLIIMLFVLTTFSINPMLILSGGLAALVLIVVRLLAKLLGSLLLGPASGLSFKQSFALGVGLTPMSAVAFILTTDLMDAFPELTDNAVAVLMASIAIMQILGPLAVRWALLRTNEAKI